MALKNDNKNIVKPKNIINEFENFEIEEKFQLVGKPTNSFLKEVENALLKSSYFKIVRGFEEFKWIFNFDYYAIRKENRMEQLFQIIHHKSTPKFWVRTKRIERELVVDCGNKKNWILVRRETTEVINKPYSKRLLLGIFDRFGEELNNDQFILASLVRQKYYTFLSNIKTGITFSLSLDFCRTKSRNMSQLEIEYKWRDKNRKEGFASINSLISEFRKMNKLLMNLDLSIEILPTKLTKFDWLTQSSRF